MELLNALTVPGLAVWIGWPRDAIAALLLAAALLPTVALLVIGGLYWRGVAHRTRERSRALPAALKLANRSERSLVALTALALAATFALLLREGASRTMLAAAVSTLLAVLEYVNYYRVQLQHFDNARDLKRLLRGRGFRLAHMARDLAAYRRGQRC
jgi:hypothetical protein